MNGGGGGKAFPWPKIVSRTRNRNFDEKKSVIGGGGAPYWDPFFPYNFHPGPERCLYSPDRKVSMIMYV